MIPAAHRLSSQYGAIQAPMTIIAGDADKVVDWARQSKALHDAAPGSCFKLFPGVGHMAHYAATSEIGAAIDEVATAMATLPAA